MRKFGVVLALLAIVVFAGPAVAQEQTGQLVGKITADGGESLPGVSVEIKGPSGTLVAVTDAKGEYRFPRVTPGALQADGPPPGLPDVRGFARPRRPRRQGHGERHPQDQLGHGDGRRHRRARPDRRRRERRRPRRSPPQQINLLPKGRDFTTVVTQAPGVSNEAFLGGISIDGASGSENRFVIDGVDTTNPQDGVSGQNFVTDFLEEVQVKSAGYAAEFGGSLGGVINAITKSGTNEFHGWVGAYYSNAA